MLQTSTRYNTTFTTVNMMPNGSGGITVQWYLIISYRNRSLNRIEIQKHSWLCWCRTAEMEILFRQFFPTQHGPPRYMIWEVFMDQDYTMPNTDVSSLRGKQKLLGPFKRDVVLCFLSILPFSSITFQITSFHRIPMSQQKFVLNCFGFFSSHFTYPFSRPNLF